MANRIIIPTKLRVVVENVDELEVLGTIDVEKSSKLFRQRIRELTEKRDLEDLVLSDVLLKDVLKPTYSFEGEITYGSVKSSNLFSTISGQFLASSNQIIGETIEKQTVSDDFLELGAFSNTSFELDPVYREKIGIPKDDSLIDVYYFNVAMKDPVMIGKLPFEKLVEHAYTLSSDQLKTPTAIVFDETKGSKISKKMFSRRFDISEATLANKNDDGTITTSKFRFDNLSSNDFSVLYQDVIARHGIPIPLTKDDKPSVFSKVLYVGALGALLYSGYLVHDLFKNRTNNIETPKVQIQNTLTESVPTKTSDVKPKVAKSSSRKEKTIPIAIISNRDIITQVDEDGVLIDGSKSYDPDGGTITSYDWYLSKDEELSKDDERVPTVEGTFRYIPSTPRNLYVILQVTDDKGDKSDARNPNSIAKIEVSKGDRKNKDFIISGESPPDEKKDEASLGYIPDQDHDPTDSASKLGTTDGDDDDDTTTSLEETKGKDGKVVIEEKIVEGSKIRTERSGVDTKSIKLEGSENQRPVARLKPLENLIVNHTYELDASESEDPDGEIKSYTFTILGDPVPIVENTNKPIYIYKPTTKGDKNIILRVLDDGEKSSAYTMRVKVVDDGASVSLEDRSVNLLVSDGRSKEKSGETRRRNNTKKAVGSGTKNSSDKLDYDGIVQYVARDGEYSTLAKDGEIEIMGWYIRDGRGENKKYVEGFLEGRYLIDNDGLVKFLGVNTDERGKLKTNLNGKTIDSFGVKLEKLKLERNGDYNLPGFYNFFIVLDGERVIINNQ